MTAPTRRSDYRPTPERVDASDIDPGAYTPEDPGEAAPVPATERPTRSSPSPDPARKIENGGQDGRRR